MSRSALLFVIAFSLCVGFFGCSKGGGGGGGGGGIATALVGIYIGDVYDLFYDDGTTESELDWYSYSHELYLYSDGTWILNYYLDGSLSDIVGTWSEQDSDTLNFFPSNLPGCTSVAVDYAFDGFNLILFYDHPCGDDYTMIEYYEYVGAPVTLPPGDRLSLSTTIGD
jgi:hypothetical protein